MGFRKCCHCFSTYFSTEAVNRRCSLISNYTSLVQTAYYEPKVLLCMNVLKSSSLPAADHSFAGQRQVEEGLAKLEGKGIFECLAIDDQCKLIFFPQRVTQGRTVSRECGTSSLQEDKYSEGEIMIFSFERFSTSFNRKPSISDIFSTLIFSQQFIPSA